MCCHRSLLWCITYNVLGLWVLLFGGMDCLLKKEGIDKMIGCCVKFGCVVMKLDDCVCVCECLFVMFVVLLFICLCDLFNFRML